MAEELHFTRAAARLHMAQQPLSASIRRLERELGVELLRRTTRRVELTEAGTALLERARAAVDAADAAVDAARAIGRGEAGVVRIGVSPGARYGLEPLLEALRLRCPGIRLRLRQASSYVLEEDLMAGAIDLGIGFCAEPSPSLSALRLKDEPAVVAVATHHRLAGLEAVELTELRGETFALVNADEGPGYNATLMGLCRQAGFEPATHEVHAGFDAWENAVLDDGCVGLTGRSAIYAARRGLRLLALTPPASFPIDLLWRRGATGHRPALAKVGALAGEVAREEGWVTAQ